jgi:hypothetical protein
MNPLRERRPLALRRRTAAAGVLVFGSTLAVLAGEVARVWKRGSAPRLSETEHVLEAAATAARETGQVVRSGYRQATARETALLALLSSFTLTFSFVRTTTWLMRRRGEFGPFRSVRAGDLHIHHFVPGILLALVSGGVSILSRDESLDRWLAIPFGIGSALTLDEFALWLNLKDRVDRRGRRLRIPAHDRRDRAPSRRRARLPRPTRSARIAELTRRQGPGLGHLSPGPFRSACLL